MIPFLRSRSLLALAMSVGLLASACGDDGASADENEPDADQQKDAGTIARDAGRSDAGSTDAGSADAGSSADAGKPKAACQLLPASEVSAILGVPQKATDNLNGMQCVYASLDPEKKDVRALLEVVTNGRAIYAANQTMYRERGQTPIPQSGIGDQAYFISESIINSSMSSTVGDVLLRLNLGWGDTAVPSETQLSGERTLMLSAISRL